MKTFLTFSLASEANLRMSLPFYTLAAHNLFIAEPADAILDVLETNFGFKIISMATADPLRPELRPEQEEVKQNNNHS